MHPHLDASPLVADKVDQPRELLVVNGIGLLRRGPDDQAARDAGDALEGGGLTGLLHREDTDAGMFSPHRPRFDRYTTCFRHEEKQGDFVAFVSFFPDARTRPISRESHQALCARGRGEVQAGGGRSSRCEGCRYELDTSVSLEPPLQKPFLPLMVCWKQNSAPFFFNTSLHLRFCVCFVFRVRVCVFVFPVSKGCALSAASIRSAAYWQTQSRSNSGPQRPQGDCRKGRRLR